MRKTGAGGPRVLVTSGDPDTAARFAEAVGGDARPPDPDSLEKDLRSAARLLHVLAPAAPARTTIADGDSDAWTAGCEDLVWQALTVLQAAHRAFAGEGGHVVVVVPNIGISGCAGLVPYATAVEATRAIVKSAARQWTADGVVPSTIVVPLGVIWPDAPELVRLAVPAAGRTAALDEIADVTGWLLDLPPGATGATMIVDGGSVMAP